MAILLKGEMTPERIPIPGDSIISVDMIFTDPLPSDLQLSLNITKLEPFPNQIPCLGGQLGSWYNIYDLLITQVHLQLQSNEWCNCLFFAIAFYSLQYV